ncbi:hypothetical protein Hanom_Chr12g01117831 [Helianthus anomalus]
MIIELSHTFSQSTLPFERVAWVKLTGVPLHLVDSDVLSQVGAIFGKVLYVPKEFEEDQDLSVVRVGVLVSHHRKILDEVVLSWRSRSYIIGVEEELEVWIPDCLKRISKLDGAGNSSEEFSPVYEEHFSGVGGAQSSGGIGVAEEIPAGGASNSQGNGSKVHGEVGNIKGVGSSHVNVENMQEEREGSGIGEGPRDQQGNDSEVLFSSPVGRSEEENVGGGGVPRSKQQLGQVLIS